MVFILDMFEILFGFLIGILTIPLCLLLVAPRPSIREKRPFRKEQGPTQQQKQLLLDSFNECKQLSWLNLLISRFWVEISESQAQAYRLKTFLCKSLESIRNTGLIKDIIIEEIEIGKEAPKVESICILTKREVENLVLERSVNSINSININETYSQVFQNVNSKFKIDYNGTIRVKLVLNLFNSFSFTMNIILEQLKGDILVRLPSLNYNTRIDYAFIKPPEIKLIVEAGVSRNEGKAYFKESISNLVRRTIKFAILRMFVFPSFNNLILPLVVPSFKAYLHKIKKISLKTEENEFESLKESLSLFLSMDYKIIEEYKSITVRESSHLINEKEKISCFSFQIPKKINFPLSNPLRLYNNLTLVESKIMNLLFSFSIFKDILDLDFEISHIFNSFSSLVKINCKNESFEFIRIVFKNTIFFQRNSKEFPDFFIFKIANDELLIFNFLSSNSFCFTKKNVFKLFKILNGKKSSSTFFNKFVKETFGLFKGKKKDSSKVELPQSVPFTKEESSIVHNKLEKYYVNHNLLLLKKSFSFLSSLQVVKKILKEEIRLRLVGENPKVFKIDSEEINYKTFAVEDSKRGDFLMYSYEKEDTIVDLVEGKIIIFKLESSQNKLSCFQNCSNSSVHKLSNTPITFVSPERTFLNVYADVDFQFLERNYFSESIHTRLKKQEIEKLSEKINFVELEFTKEIKRKIEGDKGGVYIEFKTPTPELLRLIITDSKNNSLLDIQRVSTTFPFLMVLPLNSPDSLTIHLIQKTEKLTFLYLKIFNLPLKFHRESFLDCEIELSRNQKLTFPTVGGDDIVLFWEKDSNVLGYIESSETRVFIEGNGVFRTDHQYYSIVYKNKNRKKRNIKVFMGVTRIFK